MRSWMTSLGGSQSCRRRPRTPTSAWAIESVACCRMPRTTPTRSLSALRQKRLRSARLPRRTPRRSGRKPMHTPSTPAHKPTSTPGRRARMRMLTRSGLNRRQRTRARGSAPRPIRTLAVPDKRPRRTRRAGYKRRIERVAQLEDREKQVRLRLTALGEQLEAMSAEIKVLGTPAETTEPTELTIEESVGG